MKPSKKIDLDSTEAVPGRMKVLLYDVESTPNLAHVWGKYEQNVIGDFVKERQIISVAWKWLGERQVHVLTLPMFKSYKRNPEDNSELVKAFYEVMAQAHIAVGHNIVDFDDKMFNTEVIKHGLSPLPPHKAVDTLKVAKRYFRFNSNKLDDLGLVLKLGRKVKHWGFELWVRCMRGDPKAWALMARYNKKDVVLLEKIYLRLRPFMDNHPHMGWPDKHVGCPHCRGVKFRLGGWNYSKGGNSRRYQCLTPGCGKWSSVKVKGAKNKQKKASLWYS